MLATGLVGEPSFMRALGAPEPSVGGEFVKKVVEGERDADVGKVINKDGIQAY